MRLSCLDCGAQFRVDPRVRVRSFRVACRRCGAPIVHHGVASPDGEVWYVIIADQPAGPFRALLVADQLERGSLGEQPIVWREGFTDWRLLAEVPPFAEAYERWQRRRDATRMLAVDQLSIDPSDAPPRRPVSPPSTETWPLAAVEFVAEPIDLSDEATPQPPRGATVPTPGPRSFGRVSRRIAPRPEVTGMYSLAALQQEARRPTPLPVELPVFHSAALASIAVPMEPTPVEPTPIAPTPPPKPAPHFGMYVLLFVLMASVGGLAALVLLRDSEPVVVADTSDRGELSIAAMSRHADAIARAEPAPPDCTRDPSACERPQRIRIALLPDKPATADLEASLAAVRPDAKRCGLQHGAAAGKKVELELSIAGNDGRVISAIPDASDELGKCVADALRRATFPSFRQPSLALRYSVTM